MAPLNSFVYIFNMPVSLAALVGKVLGLVATPAFEALERQERTIKLRQALDLGGEVPKPTFDSVFSFAMLEYAVTAPPAGIALFKHREVQKLLRKSFTTGDRTKFLHEIEAFVQWNRLGDDLRASGHDAKAEFERFYPLLCTWADLSRTPAEARNAQLLKALLPKSDPPPAISPSVQWSLKNELKSWFNALGHTFESYEVYGAGHFEWILNIRSHRSYVRILVRGVRGEIKATDVHAAIASVAAQRTQEGWLVTDRRISQQARKDAKAAGNVFCYTLDELIEQDANWESYLDWLEAEVLRRRIPELYVPVGCITDDRPTQSQSGQSGQLSYYGETEGFTEGYLDRWLADPAKEHISVLGEFGTGKTWVALHYAWVLLRRYREAQTKGTPRPRVPVVISLRDYAKAVSMESLFSDFFFRKHELRLPSYAAFEQLNRMGKLLLIFDGFDEMAARIDRQKMIDNFWELAKAVVPGSKVILTCRTEHFPEARDGRKLLNSELQASTAKLTGEPPQFEVLELEKLSEAQIRKTLEKRGASEQSILRIISHSDLRDLATRPVMADLLIEALPDLENSPSIDLARVYLYAVRRKIERDIKDERTFTSTADKFYFLAEICWEMWTTDQISINYRQFPERIRDLFGETVSEQKELDHWHYDMMGQTLLVRNADGDYSPAHRSFMEFFVAYKFAAELGMLTEEFIDPIRQHRQVGSGTEPTDYTWTTYFCGSRAGIKPAAKQARLRHFLREEVPTLRSTLGSRPLTVPMVIMLSKMLITEDVSQHLLELIWQTRGNIENTNWLGGNAATILIALNRSGLSNQDVSDCNMNAAMLNSADLSNTVLRNCKLNQSDMRDVIARDADFTHSHMTSVNLGESTSILHYSFGNNFDIAVILEPGDENIFADIAADYYQSHKELVSRIRSSGYGMFCIKEGSIVWHQEIDSTVMACEIDPTTGVVGIVCSHVESTDNLSVRFFDIKTGMPTQGSDSHPLYRWKNANLARVIGFDYGEVRYLSALGALNVGTTASVFRAISDDFGMELENQFSKQRQNPPKPK